MMMMMMTMMMMMMITMIIVNKKRNKKEKNRMTHFLSHLFQDTEMRPDFFPAHRIHRLLVLADLRQHSFPGRIVQLTQVAGAVD